jgi:hypothetical protein
MRCGIVGVIIACLVLPPSRVPRETRSYPRLTEAQMMLQFNRVAAACFSLPTVLIFAASSQAQVTAGGALVFAWTQGGTGGRAVVLTAPGGTTIGGVGFIAVSLNSRVGIQGEVSVAGQNTRTLTQQFRTAALTYRAAHRDVLVSGLMRVRASSWCSLLIGLGSVFSTASSTTVYSPTYTDQATTDTTRLAFTMGLDFPVHVRGNFFVLPTARVHLLSRLQPDPSGKPRIAGQAGNTGFRVGVGGMFVF